MEPYKAFITILSVTSYIIVVQSQGLSQTRRLNYDNGQMADSERVYFTDNKPGLDTNAEDPSKGQLVNTNNNNNYQGQDSYTNVGQPQYASQANINQNTDPNYNKQNHAQSHLVQPLTELQPPAYSENTVPNYYAQNSHNTSSLRYGGVTEQDNLNSNDQISKQNETSFQNNGVSFAVTNIGLNLMKMLNQTANTVVSPYSIATLLALLQQGAFGESQQQISRVLQMPPEVSALAYKRLTEDVQKRSSTRNILKVANNVFVADAFHLDPAFKRNARLNFGSDITPISFAQPEQAANKINSWVAQKTLNKIEKVVTPDIVGEDSQLVLTNAVYFKGIWESMFNTEFTVPREFHLRNGGSKTALFMRIRKIMAQLGTDETIKSNILILPFEREQYSFMVILPSEGTNLEAVLTSLTAVRLAQYTKFPRQEVEVILPKFTVRADTDLNPILMKMGITNVFGPQAELSGLGTYRNISPQISSALHTAMLSIDEQGGTASAATTFVVVALSYEEEYLFKADRPFLAVLWDNQLSLPLFLARIEDPTS